MNHFQDMTAGEQHAMVRLALPFQKRMIPKRLAAGGFMLIYDDRWGREQRDQYTTTDELVAARDKLHRRNRVGNGRWNTFFAVTVPDDVYLGDQDRLDAWAPESIVKLEQAERERRQSERADLGHGRALTKAYKAEQKSSGVTAAPVAPGGMPMRYVPVVMVGLFIAIRVLQTVIL